MAAVIQNIPKRTLRDTYLPWNQEHTFRQGRVIGGTLTRTEDEED
jgi:hypothetical protein